MLKTRYQDLQLPRTGPTAAIGFSATFRGAYCPCGVRVDPRSTLAILIDLDGRRPLCRGCALELARPLLEVLEAADHRGMSQIGAQHGGDCDWVPIAVYTAKRDRVTAQQIAVKPTQWPQERVNVAEVVEVTNA